MLSVSAGRTIVGLWQRRDSVKDRARDLKELREKNMALQRMLQDMQEGTYVERVARNTLGLVKEGETIVLLPEANGDQRAGKAQSAAAGPIWWRWWKLFF